MKTTEEVSLYVGRKYKTGPYIRPALTKLSRPSAIGSRPKVPKNEDGSDSKDIVDAAIFKEDVKAYSMLQRQYDTDLRQIFNVILGQCSEDMETKVKAHDDFVHIDQGGKFESDPIELLKIIRSIMCNFQSQRLPEISIITAMQRLFNMYQFEAETVQNFK